MKEYQEIFTKLKEIRFERNQMIYDILIKHSIDMEKTLLEIMGSAQADENPDIAAEAGIIFQQLFSDRVFAQGILSDNSSAIYWLYQFEG